MAAPATLLKSSVGKKIVMAVTGIVLALFVLGHMAGNLQAFLPNGPEALDHYGAFLKGMVHGVGIWFVRGGLLLAVGLHIWAYWTLSTKSWAARPQGYKVTDFEEATFASRSMRWTGPILAAFIVFHLLHMTTGTLHPHFVEGKVYQNLVTGLAPVPIALFYVVAMGCLAFHLWHGAWSMLQTLGLSHPKYLKARKIFAVVFTILVTGGFVLVPLAVLAGVLK
ncbi:MAG TPA: succinate dehydrogenase cytochrome b subunit [Thermoanaerobaculia bacterium]|nr:succinate dehydrogenase cytochrome b subunit [Thermoanaerobaculia bacterium]